MFKLRDFFRTNLIHLGEIENKTTVIISLDGNFILMQRCSFFPNNIDY